MVRYDAGEYNCWECGAPGRATPTVWDHTATWKCDHCHSDNYVIIDTVRLRIGERMFRAGRDLATRGEHNLAAVVLVTAVEASLMQGIRDLTTWRAVEAKQPPLYDTAMDDHLRCFRKYKRKVQEFERLAGSTIDSEIIRLNREGLIPAQGLADFARLQQDFKLLTGERNRLVHFGEEVNQSAVEKGVVPVARAVFILESMFHAVFDLKRPALA